MTNTKQTNIRLSVFARRQLDALCQATGMSQSEVIQTALDRFHQSEMIQAWQSSEAADGIPDYQPTADDDDSDLP